MACRSSLGCFGCKYLKHYYYSTGNMDCKLKGHITLGFGMIWVVTNMKVTINRL